MGYKPEEKRITISFSELTQYIQCPNRHRLKYVEGHQEPENAVLAYGKACHAGLQDLYAHGVTKAKKLFQEELKKSFATLDEYEQPKFDDYLIKGKVLITEYSKSRYMAMESRGIEISLEQAILSDKVYFKGFIDLLLYDTVRKKYIIADFKTTAKGWAPYIKKDKVKLSQLYLYKYFLLKTLRAEGKDVKDEDVECAFILLRGIDMKVEVFPVPCNEAQANRAYKFLLTVIKRIYVEKKTQYKNLSGCYFCTFKDNGLCDQLNKQTDFVDMSQITGLLDAPVTM